ncbi:MAG: SAF domain-containing protein [Candidatus Gastranaerophilales bacterium]|nr:SAF domain-containing protein [Candidatus Gastranaerophilales bacterium]
MNNKKSLIAAVVTSALVFVIFGALSLQSTPNQPKPQAPKFQLVVAKTDIKKGAAIKEEDVELKEFPINVEGSYKATGEVVGRNSKSDITAGKPIIKTFIKEISIKDNSSAGIEPSDGFRAIPVLVKKSVLPPYISTDAQFDLFTRENSMWIENLKILNILDPTKDESNKMLILEIKNTDVPSFIKHQVETKGFIFIQKNKDEYGPYRFFDADRAQKIVSASAAKPPSKLPETGNIPKIDDVDISSGFFDKTPVKSGKQVEVIVGSTKSKVEF